MASVVSLFAARYWPTHATAHLGAGFGWPRTGRRPIRIRSGLLLKIAAPSGASCLPHWTRSHGSLERRIEPAWTDSI